MRPILALMLLTTAALWPAACADTPGAVVPIEVAARGVGNPEPFETSTGWTVTLDEAWVAVAAFRAYAEGSVMARFGPSLALAHGGTDPLNGRRVRAEWLEPVVLDALDPTARTLGTIDAETGSLDEASVTLDEPTGGDTRGHVAWVRGTATRGEDTIHFEGGLTLEDEVLIRRVENIALEGELAEGDRWVLTADPKLWLADAAFDRLDEGEPRTITPESQVHGALRLGLRNSRAWSAAIERNDE